MRNVVILSLDTLGDQVLRQPLFAALLDRGHSVTLVVRRVNEALVPFLDARLQTIVTDIQPYAPPEAGASDELSRLHRAIRQCNPDLLVTAPYNRTWVDEWLFLQFGEVQRVGFENPALPKSLFAALNEAREHLGRVPEGAIFSCQVDCDPEMHEGEKNSLLLRELLGESPASWRPALRLSSDDLARSGVLLKSLGLDPTRYVFGCPAGVANVPIKFWPPEGYVEVCKHIHDRHGLPVLVTGVAQEEEMLDRTVRLGERRGVRLEKWVGGPHDLGKLLGLIRQSRLYVGTDSGPMHFAGALGVPVVALFGGGTWPRFLPLARRSFVATQNLPCFGCGWQCWLDEPLCLTRVDPEKLKAGVDWILGASRDECRVDEGQPMESLGEEVIRRGLEKRKRDLLELNARLSESEADRAARLKVIQELNGQIEQLWERIKEIDADRAARLEVIRKISDDLRKSQESYAAAEQARAASEGIRSELSRQLEASEADRAARLEVINQMADRIQKLEVEKDSQRVTLRGLEMRIAEMSTTRWAARRLAAGILRRIGLYEPLKRVRSSLRGETATVPRPAPPPAPSRPIDSPRLETFAVARTLPGGISDLALDFLFEAGSSIGSVLCPKWTERAAQAAYALARAGARVTCTGAGGRKVELDAVGVEVFEEDLARWMIESKRGTLAGFHALLLDFPDREPADEGVLRLLKGRLSPNAKIFTFGARHASFENAVEVATGLGVCSSPSKEYIDPAHRDPRWYDAEDWPWRPRKTDLPPTLPSGRPWPRISVLTVTYNQAEYLEETLRSVLMQGYPNLEYLVLDGNSTDGTPGILARYRQDLAYCVSEKDEGQSDALNKGFGRATGDILAWLNSDDRYLPGALVRVALAFDTYGADMVAGGCALSLNRDPKPFSVHHNSLALGKQVALPLDRLLDIEGSWIKGDFFWQPEVFWTRSIWEKSGSRVAKDLYYSMDYDLWVRMARAGATIVHIPDALAIYRMHESQKTSGQELPYLPELRQVSGEYLKGLR